RTGGRGFGKGSGRRVREWRRDRSWQCILYAGKAATLKPFPLKWNRCRVLYLAGVLQSHAHVLHHQFALEQPEALKQIGIRVRRGIDRPSFEVASEFRQQDDLRPAVFRMRFTPDE